MNNIESKPKDLEMVEGWLTIARENNNKLAIQIIENLFPSLCESEDERTMDELLDYLKRFIPHNDIDLVRKSKVWIAWLEKQGEQKPAEWSKKDNEMLNNVIKRIKALDHYWNKPTDEKMIDWLKSLKPQNRWKPSEYDISLLEEIARNIRNDVRPFCSEVSALEDLISNIKTL